MSSHRAGAVLAVLVALVDVYNQTVTTVDHVMQVRAEKRKERANVYSHNVTSKKKRAERKKGARLLPLADARTAGLRPFIHRWQRLTKHCVRSA